MIRYGIRIGKKLATIHVGEFKASLSGAYLGGVWFGFSSDIFDNEADAKDEIAKRLREAVAMHAERLSVAESRLVRFEKEGPAIKRHKP